MSEYKDIENKMVKAISALKEELVGIRAGRANPAILDKITVDYYGVPTPINQLGSISVPEARVIVIQPWDAKILKDIEKAIQKSDIGINPSNDGKVIRLIFPVLTEERRKELTKQVKKIGENAKVAIRNVRRDALEDFKTQKKNGEITEDDLKVAENDIQKLTDKYIDEVDKLMELKEKEIMEV
ncbi:MAG TPA: ribosome recycling factor [Clostridiales bacterium]|nr:ribosome recycling factor [Clostridiales bacterium]